MKAVVGQTEYLHSLMRMAQTRPPSLTEIGSRELESKDLCRFEAKGMRKRCLPTYRDVFSFTMTNDTVPHTEPEDAHSVPKHLLDFPAILKSSIFSLWLLQRWCFKVLVILYYKSQDECVAHAVSVISVARVGTWRVAVLSFVLASLCKELHQPFLKEKRS